MTKINTVCVEDTRNLLFFFLKLHVNVQYLRNYDDKLKKKKYCNTDCRNAILCLASPVTIYTRITASYMIIQHAIFFSNFYVFYPIIEYRCPCKSSAFFSSRSTILLFYFYFVLFFISFSLNFLIFFFTSRFIFSPLSLFKVEKTRATYNIIYSINRTYALFIIIALYYYRCHYSNYHYDYELLYIEYRPRSQLLRTLCNLNRLLFHNTI